MSRQLHSAPRGAAALRPNQVLGLAQCDFCTGQRGLDDCRRWQQFLKDTRSAACPMCSLTQLKDAKQRALDEEQGKHTTTQHNFARTADQLVEANKELGRKRRELKVRAAAEDTQIAQLTQLRSELTTRFSTITSTLRQGLEARATRPRAYSASFTCSLTCCRRACLRGISPAKMSTRGSPSTSSSSQPEWSTCPPEGSSLFQWRYVSHASIIEYVPLHTQTRASLCA